MELGAIKGKIPDDAYSVLEKEGIVDLRPSQEKAIKAGLLDFKSLLICTPTASGKTLIGELAGTKSIIEGRGKVVYIVPLIALANEKFKDFDRKYGKLFKIAQSSSDMDATDSFLVDYDFIVCTAEKFDSLIRHQAPWLKYVKTVIIDEIHMMNDVSA